MIVRHQLLNLFRLAAHPQLFLDQRNDCVTLSYMNTITVRIPDSLKVDLQKISDEQHKPVSDLVRESIRRFVAVERFRQLRKKSLPFAEAQGLLTDDEIFDAIS
jgi:predicted transcriptional regulator